MANEHDSKSPQVSYSDHFPELIEALKEVDQPGDFYASGIGKTAMPSISVDGTEPLSFPVPASQSRELIAAAGEKAPYGRGADTLVDESVRKVWQINPKNVRISGKGWSLTLKSIIATVAKELGCKAGTVSAEFSMVLISTLMPEIAISAILVGSSADSTSVRILPRIVPE